MDLKFIGKKIKVLPQISNYKYLWIDGNKIRKLPDISKLKVITCEYNRIKKIQYSFINKIEISYYGNKIKDYSTNIGNLFDHKNKYLKYVKYHKN